ncbi:tetratricopeptide repeat protein [Bacteroidota bacterium]
MLKKIFISLLIITSSLLAQATNFSEQIKLARSYEDMGEYKKAEALYKALLNQQPTNNIFLEGLNRIYLRTKNYESSISLLENKIAQFPDDITAHGLLGTTYHMMDETKKAFEIWNDALEINPGSPIAYRTIAQFVIQQRALDEGIEILKLGRRRLNQPDSYAYDLASLYTTMMKFKEAAEEYCFMLLKQPKQLSGIKGRMKGYLFRNDALKITLDYVHKFIEENSTPELFELLGFLYQSSGDYNSAIEYFKLIPYSSKENETDLINFANEALNIGEYNAATKTFELVKDKYPNSPNSIKASIGLARALELSIENSSSINSESWKPYNKTKEIRGYDFQPAIESYQEIINISINPQIKSEASYRLAKIFKDKYQEYETADSLFEIITMEFPQSQFLQRAFIQRGEIAVSRSSLEEAESYFTFAAQLLAKPEEDNSYSQYMRVKTLLWQNRFNEIDELLTPFTSLLESDHANDAIELSVLIHTLKSDSLGLSKYASADLLLEQGKFQEAAEFLKELQNSYGNDLPGITAGFKYAQILIAEDELPLAAALLDEIVNSDFSGIFQDKALYLQAQIYQHGIKDKLKAISIYENLLANFPNSLYLDEARENLLILKPKY